MLRLQVEPKLRTGAEELCKPYCSVCCYAALLVYDFSNTRERHAQEAGKLVGRNVPRLHKFFAQNFAWMCFYTHTHLTRLVVVDNFNLRCCVGAFVPAKTDAPLIVDADAVLSRSVSPKCF